MTVVRIVLVVSFACLVFRAAAARWTPYRPLLVTLGVASMPAVVVVCMLLCFIPKKDGQEAIDWIIRTEQGAGGS